MSYLLDTSLISELVRAKPSERVVQWFREVPDEALYLSVLTLGEIRKGVERLCRRRAHGEAARLARNGVADVIEGLR